MFNRTGSRVVLLSNLILCVSTSYGFCECPSTATEISIIELKSLNLNDRNNKFGVYWKDLIELYKPDENTGFSVSRMLCPFHVKDQIKMAPSAGIALAFTSDTTIKGPEQIADTLNSAFQVRLYKSDHALYANLRELLTTKVSKAIETGSSNARNLNNEKLNAELKRIADFETQTAINTQNFTAAKVDPSDILPDIAVPEKSTPEGK